MQIVALCQETIDVNSEEVQAGKQEQPDENSDNSDNCR